MYHLNHFELQQVDGGNSEYRCSYVIKDIFDGLRDFSKNSALVFSGLKSY